MGQQTQIVADGESAVTHFFGTLISQAELLELFVWRDAEALRILTAASGLLEAYHRVEKAYWRKQAGKERTPRIWTRRDEKRLAWMGGRINGCCPMCRVARLLNRFSSPENDQNWQSQYRLAKDEVTQNGTAIVVLPLLSAARDAHERLLSAARREVEWESPLLPGFRDELIGHQRAMAELATELPTPGTVRGMQPRLTSTEARAKFCYEQWQSGKTYKEINVCLKNNPEWEQFENETHVRGPIKMWGDRIGIPPRMGNRGRPAKT